MSPDTYEVPEYPLEIESYGGRYWSKGWQPQEDFLDYVEDYDGERHGDEASVRYEVWKFVPDPHDPPGFYWESRLGTRGAFPVTVIG